MVLAGAMLVVIGRMAHGPTAADRALAVDAGFTVFIAGLAVLAVRLDAPVATDLVLAATLLGFLGTVALAQVVESGAT